MMVLNLMFGMSSERVSTTLAHGTFDIVFSTTVVSTGVEYQNTSAFNNE